LLFSPLGLRPALAVALVTGNRSIALVLAAAAPFLVAHPLVERYLSLCVVVTFLLPAAGSWFLVLVRRFAARVSARDGPVLKVPGFRHVASHASALLLGLVLGTSAAVVGMTRPAASVDNDLVVVDRRGQNALAQPALGVSREDEQALRAYVSWLEEQRGNLSLEWGETAFATTAALGYARLAVLAEDRGDAVRALARFDGAAFYCEPARIANCSPEQMRLLIAGFERLARPDPRTVR
jgi:hypothetical protein